MHTEPPGCAKQRNKCTSKVPSVCLSKLYNIITVPLGSKYTHLFSEEKKKEKKITTESKNAIFTEYL